MNKIVVNLKSPEWIILLGLMAPTVTNGMNHHMFSVALPAIRSDFALSPDTVAWVSMVYSLPFMALMPLYGRLGDGLGKKRLLIFGMSAVLLGTVIILTSTSLPTLMIGRVFQGLGGAGLNVLCIAIIAQLIAPGERGKMLGTWNSAMPLVGFIAPFLAGLLIDNYSWRAIFPLVLVAGIGALMLVRRNIPELSGNAPPGFLRSFDWPGVVSLTLALILFFVFTSSRPITGVEPLRDMRLLAAFVAVLAWFVWWEFHHHDPYVNLKIFRNRSFTLASLIAGLRMLLMTSVSFLMPLYLSDISQRSASVMGLMLALQAGALFMTSRYGGQLADKWGSRRPILISLTGQVLVMLLMAQLPANAPLWIIAIAVAFQGLSVGLSLAPLHRGALQGFDGPQTGTAAGVYSMIRFAGIVLGTSLAGVLLQLRLDGSTPVLDAYQSVFWMYTLAALLALGLAFMLKAEAKQ